MTKTNTLGPLMILAMIAAGAAAADVSKDWGEVNGKPVKLYTIENAQGVVMKVTNYGAIITELHVPDRAGKTADVVLGFDNLKGYLDGHPYFGAIAGRCANRIDKGQFELDGKKYQLATNNGLHHLHGGDKGFDKRVWDATLIETEDGRGVRLTHVSPNGEENYPGELKATVTYVLTDDNKLLVDMKAETDAATVVNLAQHTYWNLAGHDSGNILGHLLQLNADGYTPVDDTLIPTGKIAPVQGTPFDFSQPKAIGKDLQKVGGDPIGYDHNFVVRGKPNEMKLVAKVQEPKSGRTLEIHANQPGVQFYTGNFLDGKEVGKGGNAYRQYGGFCLETQKFPNSINEPEWPSVVLEPGEKYEHKMVIQLGVK